MRRRTNQALLEPPGLPVPNSLDSISRATSIDVSILQRAAQEAGCKVTKPEESLTDAAVASIYDRLVANQDTYQVAPSQLGVFSKKFLKPQAPVWSPSPPPPKQASTTAGPKPAPHPPKSAAVQVSGEPVPASKCGTCTLQVDGTTYVGRVGKDSTVFLLGDGIGVEVRTRGNAAPLSPDDITSFVRLAATNLATIRKVSVGKELLDEFKQGGKDIPSGDGQYEGLRLLMAPLVVKSGIPLQYEPIQTSKRFGRDGDKWIREPERGEPPPSIPVIQLPVLRDGQALVYTAQGQGGGALLEGSAKPPKDSKVVLTKDGVSKHPDFSAPQPYDVTIFHELVHAYLAHKGLSKGMKIKDEEAIVCGIGPAQGARYSENTYRLLRGDEYPMRATYKSVGLDGPAPERTSWPRDLEAIAKYKRPKSAAEGDVVAEGDAKV